MSSVIYYGGSAGDLTYQGFASGAYQSSRTFSIASVPFGAARSDRRAFCTIQAVFDTADCALSSATIGGTAAAVHVQRSRDTSGWWFAAIISAPLPTGTTATVGLTFAAGSTGYQVIGLGAYRVTGLQSPTASATIATTAVNTATASGTIDVTKYGVLLACCTSRFGGALTTVGVPEDYDTAVSGTVQIVSGGQNIGTTEAGRTVSFTQGGAGNAAMVAASFR